MNKCYDANKTLLNVGDAVMCTQQNGIEENEGLVADLLPNNQIILDGENGMVTVDASSCFYLP